MESAFLATFEVTNNNTEKRDFVLSDWYSVKRLENKIFCSMAVQDRETTVYEDIHLAGSIERGLKSFSYKPEQPVDDLLLL